MSVIRVEDIAHVRYAAPDLAEMQRFLTDFGLACFTQDGRLYARGTDGRPFLHVTEPGEAGFRGIGFRAASVADLETLAAHDGAVIEDLGEPGGGKVVRLTDPDGYSVEVVAGQRNGEPGALLPDQPVNTASAKPRWRSSGWATEEAKMSKLKIHPTEDNGRIVHVTPESAGWTYVGFEVGQIRKQGVAGLLPAEPVQGAVGQDPLEQHGQFGQRLVAVVLGQLHHAVLDDVQGGFLVANVVDRALESPFLDAFQEVGKFSFGGQGGAARAGRDQVGRRAVPGAALGGARLSHCRSGVPGRSSVAVR